MECKLADADEMRECFSQVYSQWPHADDPSLHLQRRLASVQHKRASWFVGKINETLVCSLGAYPVQLIGPGGRREARCFGAVFTPEMHRRQGFAAQLLNWVMDYYARDHVQDFLLFSDIDPKFYEKLGFCCLPSYQWAWDLPQSALANSEGLIEYAIEPRDPGLLDCRLGLTRSAQEARWVQEKQAPQLRLSHVFDAEGQATGEWLLSRSEAGHYQLLEANILQTAEHWPRFCRLIDSDARAIACRTVEGWWTARAAHPDPELQPEVKPRLQEILMWSSRRRPGDAWREILPGEGFRVFLSEHV